MSNAKEMIADMAAGEIAAMNELTDTARAVIAVLEAKSAALKAPAPVEEQTPARMSDAEFLSNLQSIATGQLHQRARGIVPAGEALPAASVQRGDTRAFLDNIALIASGRVKVG